MTRTRPITVPPDPQERPEAAIDEVQLVAAMRAGDEAAFDTFAEIYVPAGYRYASSRLQGDRELTRDIAQTTICKALEKLSSFRGEASLMTWLCACCRNEIAMHFRRRGTGPREVPLEEEDGPAPILRMPSSDGPEREALRGEASRLVHLALDQLPKNYARSLEWKYVDRLPVKEIATRLEVGAKAAESLLTRARIAFREGHTRLVREMSAGSLPSIRLRRDLRRESGS